VTDYVAPDWARPALITIDTQRDFTVPGGPFVIPGTLEIVPAMARLGRAFRARGRPVVHVVRLYLADGTNADLCRRDDIERGQRMGVPGTAGAELMDDLLPPPGASLDATSLLAGERQPVGPREWIMYKPRWGAFYGTRLEEHLRALDVDTVVVCGCNFPNCPRATIYEASERDFRLVLAIDAVSGLYERGMEELRNIGVSLLRADECLP
jgi:nicotinamidase-related amidase